MSIPWVRAEPEGPGTFRRWWDKDHLVWQHWLWDGTNKRPVILRGWWDGARLRPLFLLGWWDGFEVQPVTREEVA